MKYEELTPELQEELKQLFRNNSDCYADTWEDFQGEMVEGEVIQAITEERFLELIMSETAKRIHTQGSGTPQGYISIEEHKLEVDKLKLKLSVNVGALVNTEVRENENARMLYEANEKIKKSISIEEHERIVHECILQFEYLNGKFGETGTTNAILAKLKSQQNK